MVSRESASEPPSPPFDSNLEPSAESGVIEGEEMAYRPALSDLTSSHVNRQRSIVSGKRQSHLNVASSVVSKAQNVKRRYNIYGTSTGNSATPVLPDPDDGLSVSEGDTHSAIQHDENLNDLDFLVLPQNPKIQAELDKAYETFHKSHPDPEDPDTFDVVMVTEHTNDIFPYLHELELKYRPDRDYMDRQPELRWSYRSTLIDWIVQLHERFMLLPETLYLTVNIIDRFLSLKTVTLNRFQLVGASALFIASKYEEINCPTLKSIVCALDNAYTKEQLTEAERYMINTLNFEIGWPGPMSFLRRVSKADDYEHDFRTLAKYLLESTIMDSRLITATPSLLASGAYFLSRVILGSNDWTLAHVYYSGYTQDQLFQVATIILENCRNPSKRHSAIWHKYSSARQYKCALIVDKWIAMAEEKV